MTKPGSRQPTATLLDIRRSKESQGSTQVLLLERELLEKMSKQRHIKDQCEKTE